MLPHPRPLPRDDVACVGHSGSRGRGETRGQRRTRSQIAVETTNRAPRAPTGTHSTPIRHSPGDWLIFPPPTPIPPEKIPTHLRPRLRENVPVPLRTRNRHPQAPNPPTSNESTTNGAFPLRGKVPKGRMRGRVANGEDARIPSREQQLDVPPPPAPPPRRGRLCWAQRVARERGGRAANGEVVRRSPSKRPPEHPTPPQEPAPPPTAIAPGTGSFSRPPPQSHPKRFQPTSAQDRGKMCLSPSGPPQTPIGNPSAVTLGCATTDRASANCPRCDRLPRPNSSGQAQPAPTDVRCPQATAHPATGGCRPQTPTEFRGQSFRGQS